MSVHRDPDFLPAFRMNEQQLTALAGASFDEACCLQTRMWRAIACFTPIRVRYPEQRASLEITSRRAGSGVADQPPPCCNHRCPENQKAERCRLGDRGRERQIIEHERSTCGVTGYHE